MLNLALKVLKWQHCSTVPPIIQLSTTLRFLATGAFQGVIVQHLIIAKDVDISLGRSTVSTFMWRVINAAENIICPQWIKIEMTTDEKLNSKAYFFQKCQIPGVVGCIDGTHAKLNKPCGDESHFFNRKGTFSVNAMIICDYNMKVRAVDARRPGSCHDSFIWKLSRARDFFLHNYLNGDTNSLLLGDSGYGLELFLLSPYKDVVAGTAEHKFNNKHASGRNIVERTIGVLKSRFRCLMGTLLYTPQKVVQIINVCCALHNICREYNVECDEDLVWEDNVDYNDVDEVEDFSQRNMFNIAKRLRDNISAQFI
ncbi:putative nuclease HARBI1 [Calliphora vicina]|uniref:putative nuclease HARBI1 n=1 Tax=Calliphora vicina TaxID=7373 RepID=UPI00325B81EC